MFPGYFKEETFVFFFRGLTFNTFLMFLMENMLKFLISMFPGHFEEENYDFFLRGLFLYFFDVFRLEMLILSDFCLSETF